MTLKNLSSLSEWRKIINLYKAAFPSYERKPLWLVWIKHREKKADVWVLEEAGEFLGLAITMNGMDMVLLDYFAICEEKRGQGLGTEALRILQEHYKGKRLFLEIESVYVQADNLHQRHQRKQFYSNNGMTEVGVIASVFGTDLELLGYNCTVSFEDYYSLYCASYGKRIAEHLVEVDYPNEKQ